MPEVGSFPVVRNTIAGVALSELASQYGTPTYVYDAAKIVERINDLRAFDHIRYAQKACSNLAVLDLMRRNGVFVDAVSAGEVHRARAAGFALHGNPTPVVYTADIFDRESLDLVVDQDIHVNAGSIDMIEQLGARAPGRAVTLRINPGFGHGHSQKTNTGGEQSKHGIWHTELGNCLAQIDRFGMTVSGIHMHIGSGTDLEHLSQVCGALEAIVAKVGRSVTSISAGGGLPIAYHAKQTYVDLDAYYRKWDATRRSLQEELGHPVSLEIEPGRYLVAESGFLITEIRAVKRQGNNTFYLLDAGFNNLARPILYGAYHPMSIANADGRPLQSVVVGGPLCESGDIFTQEEGGFVCQRSLPAAKVGDLLIIECAGAYGAVMASNYNSKPLAAEVIIDNGKPYLARQRQSNDDLIRGESIPIAS